MSIDGADRHGDSRRPRWLRCGSTPLAIGMALLTGCVPTNHRLVHPQSAPADLVLWSDDFARDELKMHIDGARPPGVGPFPTVLVLPEEEETAAAMHGAIWDLASRGYFAIATTSAGSGARTPATCSPGDRAATSR